MRIASEAEDTEDIDSLPWIVICVSFFRVDQNDRHKLCMVSQHILLVQSEDNCEIVDGKLMDRSFAEYRTLPPLVSHISEQRFFHKPAQFGFIKFSK